jgi:exoribonuclease-2
MPPENSLVLYKSRPARVVQVAEKIEIDLGQGQVKRVRPKDVTLLHPGPLHSLSELTPRSGEVEDAWALLEESETEIGELSELIFGEHTPGTAWAAWQLVADGLYFRGTPESVRARNAEDVARERRERDQNAAQTRAREGFLERARKGRHEPDDQRFLSEIESLACRSRTNSRVLQELDLQETPETAHRLLLRTGYWNETLNPYPLRSRLTLQAPTAALPTLPDEQRLDLTHLPAYAVDDEGNQDPDDALSMDGQRLWIHIADVAALVEPDSAADQEARARGANIYLPESISPMLPALATEGLGLGLQNPSPALSFGLRVEENAELQDVQIAPSWVNVQRISYATAQQRLREEPFASLLRLSRMFRERRQQAGGAFIRLPEVSVRVVDGEVVIRPLPALDSREMVTDCMLMAGTAAASFAQMHAIPFPYASQAPPETAGEHPQTPSAMYAYRRRFQRTQVRAAPLPHAGLGLAAYSQVTSPLRRYLDLVAHQQLRAFLRGAPLLSEKQITTRIGAATAMTDRIRSAERSSNRHWTMVHLLRKPNWRGHGILVEENEGRGVVLVPELGLEARVRIRESPALDTEIALVLTNVDLPDLRAHFRTDS